jgi:hypothetical protein
MYPDTKRIRNNRFTLRFDEYEHDLIQVLANYQGEQPSTLLQQTAEWLAKSRLRKQTKQISGRGRALYPVDRKPSCE